LTLSEFIEWILNDIGHADPANGIRQRCFTMDNLYVHHNPLIAQMIFAKGHRLAFRAPYYPVDGPIEYVFNTLQQALTRRLYLIHTQNDLYVHIHAII
jgi:transposase